MPENKKHSKTLASDRKEEVNHLLHGMGKGVYDTLDNGVFPELALRSRSVKNIVYSEEVKQYVLGSSTVRRSSGNVKHIRPFAQLMWLGLFSKLLINQGKTSTLRDVYYSSQAYDIDFTDQSESDEIITDLEVVLAKSREDFNIYPEERSAIFGDVTIEYTVKGYEGKKLNLASHPDGYLIGPSLSTSEFVDTSAEMIIAVEKGGVFTRFVEEKVHEKYHALIIDTAGQPPRSTRYMLKRLSNELNLPLNIFTDGDVYGEHIAMVIIAGSANAAHLRDLAVPRGKWLGVWGSDITKYKLPSDPLTDIDIKRVHELKRDPRYTGGIWQRELDVFLKLKRKSELEAFSKYGLTAVVDKYLPEKLEMAKSL